MSGIIHFKLNIFCVHVWERSLVLILRVFCIHRVYRGSFFFSFVLILRICTYLGIKGDNFFSDLGFFFGARFTSKLVYYNLYHQSEITQNRLIFTQNWMYQICIWRICISFSTNWSNTFKNWNCIRSIWTKTNTNLLHINFIHSILRKIRHVIQIVVHWFVHKTSAKKNTKVWKKSIPLYLQVPANT